MKLRAGTYNIMNGGGGRWSDQLGVVADLGLDLLGIQEAKHWDRDRFRRMFASAREWGMQPLFAPSASHGSHLVLFYRWPRLQVVEHTPDIGGGFHHTASRTVFHVQGLDRPVIVLHTHLDPASPEHRLKEAGWLTEYTAPGVLSIVIGDLNTIGPDDDEPENWSLIPAHLHSRHRLVLPDGSYGGADRRAARALMGPAHFIDPPVQLGIPAPRTSGYWPGAEGWDHRSDYVLISPGLGPALESYRFIDNLTTQRLGDHLPGVAILNLQVIR